MSSSGEDAHPTPYEIPDPRLSDRVQHFPESVIREMTRLPNLHGAINLSQGFPDTDPPAEILAAAEEAPRTAAKRLERLASA